jgi:glucose 1-dehydrogenase
MALAFAAEGAHVVIGDVREQPREGGAPTLELIEAGGGDGSFVEADLRRGRCLQLA